MSKQNKYNAKAITVDGIKFHSTGEAKRWSELQLLVRSGEIIRLRRQVPIDLCFTNHSQDLVRITTPSGRCMRYVADFEYFDAAKNKTILEDFKGFDTEASLIKRALVKAFYGLDILVTR